MSIEEPSTYFWPFKILASEHNETALQNNCIEQNDIQKGSIWQQSHSTGCMAEYGESHCSEMKQLKT